MKPKSNNIIRLFLNAATNNAQQTAIVEGNTKISYSVLHREVLETAAYLKSKNISQGDRILVFVPMSIDLYRILLAIFYCGATAVFLDEWVNRNRLNVCCRLADCKGFIGSRKAGLLRFLSPEIRKIPIKLNMRGKLSTRTTDVCEVSMDDAALITFTTGSTGIPKAALRSHSFLFHQFNALVEEINPQPLDIDMPVLPIVLFVNLGMGCTSVIAKFNARKPEKIKPKRIIRQLEQEQVNRISSSPFFIRKLSEYILHNKPELHCIENIFTGGAPVFPSEAVLFKKAFTKTNIHIVYGSTEAEPISSIEAVELIEMKEHLDTGLPVGKIFPAISIRIIKWQNNTIKADTAAELKKLVLPEGEMGEIIVSGDHVLKNYFNNQKAFDENKIRCDQIIWHRTGDSGFLKNGMLFLTGRCKQLIETQHGYVSPFIIENKLLEKKGIQMGTMLKTNEKVYLILETELDKQHAELLVNDMTYDQLTLLKKIPRDPRHHSKIDYDKLRELI